jgi:CRISPR/Cas system CSM-associated protein Csm2 small subunit
MTKWTLPQGRKPLTDADIAALTRRLAGTAVDYKELYEAAKRDAEEAEAYAEELEAKLDTMVAALAYEGRRTDAAEAKLVTVQEVLKGALDSLLFASAELKAQAHIPLEDAELIQNRIDQVSAIIAKLKGEKDD